MKCLEIQTRRNSDLISHLRVQRCVNIILELLRNSSFLEKDSRSLRANSVHISMLHNSMLHVRQNVAV